MNHQMACQAPWHALGKCSTRLVALQDGNVHMYLVLGYCLFLKPGTELDKRKVPKCHLARNDSKGGKANILPRQDHKAGFNE